MQDSFEQIDKILDFKRFLSRLQNMDACIYYMHRIDHMNWTQIATLCGLNDKTVKKSFKETSKKASLFYK